ncbi:MAG: FHA domain-containing protein [Bacteroidota bacterium]|nr:FHA domain-containing protein [Bacteroidota bacterium]
MSRETTPNRATQALATAGRIMGGADVPVYTLQHLQSSEKHKAGEFEKIVVPYIEIGRASTSVVKFGDDCPTVSRKHASISREDKTVKITNQSQTNPTLVNGVVINGATVLNNGDEIQLSQNGPKMLYNTTTTGTARMGFTGKMNLVVSQAIKPYRSLILTLSAILLLAIAGGGYLIFDLTKKNEQLAVDMNKTKNLLQGQADSLQAMNKNNKELQDKLNSMAGKVEKGLKKQTIIIPSKGRADVKYSPAIDIVKPYSKDVFLLEAYQIIVTKPDGNVITLDGGWSGTGFLCEDGKFITAHHCVNGWFYNTDETFLTLNAIAMNGGKVVAKLRATSPDGRKLEFTSDEFKVDLDKLKKLQVNLNGEAVLVALGNVEGAEGSGDWAYIQTDKKGTIKYNARTSDNLQQGAMIHILGYPHGTDHVNATKLQPLYCTTQVAQDGLTKGIINTTNRGFDHGNSGGPCFWIDPKTNTCYAIGLVSASPSDASPIGMLVPLSWIK